jgi:alpha-mannosidase
MGLEVAAVAQDEAATSPDSTREIEEILLLHHSHLDVGYTHSQPVLWELQVEFISQALDWLEQTRDLPDDHRPRWTCEATEPVRRWLAQASPGDVERFRTLHREGRIGLSALRWHISSAVDRAGLGRLLAGKAELEELTGEPIRVACQHDVNGVPWALADALLDNGVDLFVMAVNPHLGRAVQPRPGMFMWEAPSGRTLRVFNGHHYTMFDQLLRAWDDSVDRMAEGWSLLAERLRELSYPLPFVYLTTTCSPILWDNAPPNPFVPDLVRRWNEAELGPRIRYATFDDLRRRALTIPDDELPVLRGDWTDYWSFGYGSAPGATSLNQRAKALAAAASSIAGAQTSPLIGRALEQIDLYDEHTFGYWDTADEHPLTQTTELLKQARAHEGHELAGFAVMDALERLAGNPVADKGVTRVLLCNPSLQPISVYPELPEAWFFEPNGLGEHAYQASRIDVASERTYRASRMAYEGGPRWDGSAVEGARVFGRLDLPPRSWRSIPLDELPSPPSKALVHRLDGDTIERRELNRALIVNHARRIGVIESSLYRLRYEPSSGQVVSLVDLVRDRELLACRPGIDLFSVVRERTDRLSANGRYAYYQRDLDNEKVDLSCWQEWAPVHETPTRLLQLEIHESPTRITLERRLQAPGFRRLVQRISILPDDPVIRFEAELDLEPDPEPQGIYFALPLAVAAGWAACFDSAGETILLDDDQLPGACRNWAAVETMAAIGDESGAVGLLCPDAPLVQFGDFHFGAPVDAIERTADPLLLAWPINNYWDTNFPRLQHGRIRLRYGLVALDRLDRDALREHGERFRQPVLTWPVTTNGQAQGSGPLPTA